jgi:hypothetical protein
MYAAHVILISEEHREIEQATPMSLYPRVYYSHFNMVLKVMSTERSDMWVGGVLAVSPPPLQSSQELLCFVFLFPLCVVLPNRDRDPFIDDLGQDKSAEMKITTYHGL